MCIVLATPVTAKMYIITEFELHVSSFMFYQLAAAAAKMYLRYKYIFDVIPFNDIHAIIQDVAKSLKRDQVI